MPVLPACRKPRQEDHKEVKDRVGHTVSPKPA